MDKKPEGIQPVLLAVLTSMDETVMGIPKYQKSHTFTFTQVLETGLVDTNVRPTEAIRNRSFLGVPYLCAADRHSTWSSSGGSHGAECLCR